MFQLFKKPDIKRFDLKPRYWNPEQEAREERIKRAKAELGLDEKSDQYIPDMKGKLCSEYHRRRAEKASYNSKYVLRLFMILIMIFIAAFLIFMRNSEGILRFFGK